MYKDTFKEMFKDKCIPEMENLKKQIENLESEMQKIIANGWSNFTSIYLIQSEIDSIKINLMMWQMMVEHIAPSKYKEFWEFKYESTLRK